MDVGDWLCSLVLIILFLKKIYVEPGIVMLIGPKLEIHGFLNNLSASIN